MIFHNMKFTADEMHMILDGRITQARGLRYAYSMRNGRMLRGKESNWAKAKPGDKLLASNENDRWATKLTLEVKAVRKERVQEITEKEANKEGFYDDDVSYADKWDSIHGSTGPKSWKANPPVVVIEFERKE